MRTLRPEDGCCDFDPYDDEHMPDPPEESWHFRRVCEFCGTVWYGLHCIHDGRQNPCPGCDRRPIPVPDDW